ncbi:hypothetical protein P5P86_02210 [Nocardioides sp. BP30]|uniref:hypothetical protein n=1 Tax=Nocardioides sp. BP30 TaxID=3036374 RepID=UPI0024689002|nr:hypothetical protein [Nocardioides sp. BP30]WGL52648.1 hypothetical protein P5P86_02210 [Nocardioides sp. BP30]
MRRTLPVPFAGLIGVLGLLSGLVVMGSPAPSYAAATCTPVAPAAAAQQADAVFTGVLAGAGQTDTKVKPKRFTYPVRVQTSLKGSATGQVNVITRGGGCGIGALQPGTTYLFFVTAHGHSWLAPGTLGTTSQNVAAASQQVVAALAPPTVTFDHPQVGAPASLRRIAAPGVALVLIGLLGLLFVRRTPRSQA